MSDRGPLTAAELDEMERFASFNDLGVHAEEGDAARLQAMVTEIRMHRDAMAPHILRATRLYTDELGELRRRVAQLERALQDYGDYNRYYEQIGRLLKPAAPG